MRFLTRSLVALLLAACSVAALGYAGYTLFSAIQDRNEATGRPATGRERVFTVRAVPVTPAEISPTLSAFGEVRTQRALELRAPVGGRVLEVAQGFEDGAEVTEGQLLFRIDPADAISALALAQSDLSRAQAELRDAERALSLAAEDVDAAQAQYDLRERALIRRQGLAERGVATEAALEEAELALSSARQAVVGRRQAQAQADARADQARTALERQRISVNEAQRRLDDTRVHASFTGTLADVNIVEGRIVNTSEQLARIIDPAALEVSVRLSTAQYLRLLNDDGALRDAGAEIALEVAGFEITSPGRVLRASATVEQGQSGRRLFVELNAPRGFRPGDFVTVRLQEPALQNVALLPASAVNAAGNVLVINDDNRLTAMPVSVLRRQGDDVIIRADGLAGREVVREVTPNLGTGIQVSPRRESADGGPLPEAAEMVTLDASHRARLIAQVEGNSRMPEQIRARLLAQLSQDQVPAQMIERIENTGAGQGGAGQGGGPMRGG
ncbi:efflux RND transporter periplasmic adaptor subunit [Roseinatronobacter alkalisoli]|uniref:HlyD family efflux transporter periplasmic adaptor subunit n=1 Tax=Roseinatronobacter alkalisoli TaxID=3028235 RepID=A0ABT5TB86_9RHOB|nr:HlyD family efflux transporter periplasmic adaptor subunit [Roseinatronobacter sp. HJB301]MDD7972382.1 HlyD family efflux transporter periplasmic adaptor subunit [Roseinatronobacter sp. HJB301]